jgi:hypothetical protein
VALKTTYARELQSGGCLGAVSGLWLVILALFAHVLVILSCDLFVVVNNVVVVVDMLFG